MVGSAAGCGGAVSSDGGIPCGNPLPLVSPLYQHAGGFLHSGRSIGAPKLHIREFDFVSRTAVRMIEDNHPSDRLSFVQIALPLRWSHRTSIGVYVLDPCRSKVSLSLLAGVVDFWGSDLTPFYFLYLAIFSAITSVTRLPLSRCTLGPMMLLTVTANIPCEDLEV